MVFFVSFLERMASRAAVTFMPDPSVAVSIRKSLWRCLFLMSSMESAIVIVCFLRLWSSKHCFHLSVLLSILFPASALSTNCPKSSLRNN